MRSRATRPVSPAYVEFSHPFPKTLCIAGVDEVGRGPLAGPVIAAAVIFPPRFVIAGITDSKKLTPKQRETFFPLIRQGALAIGLGYAGPREIDRLNILEASLLAMKKAVQNLVHRPDLVLVDGNRPLALPLAQNCLIGGDGRSLTIGAASIVAKVVRDKVMEASHGRFPVYNFRSNKGYGTEEHLEALRRFGPCPFHRRSFRGVRSDG
jgi:ribonuclease HII